jgi:hypothetical protein
MNEKPQIGSDRLAPLFWASFADFLQEERDNILSGVSEQNLCGRLAIFLEGYSVMAALPIMSSIQSTTVGA